MQHLSTTQHDPGLFTAPASMPTSADPVAIAHGDALDVLRFLPDKAVDSIATDPPYGRDKEGNMLGQVSSNYHEKATHSRGFADNDPASYRAWSTAWSTEALRVLKPGGLLVAFGSPRTAHLMAIGIEEAGFEIRDGIVWEHGTGRPFGNNMRDADGDPTGWNTTLKSTFEPAVVARRPMEGTLKANFAHYGTGAFNVGATRIPVDGGDMYPSNTFIDEDVAARLGDVARPFHIVKAGSSERPRVEGLEAHPTVKPLGLMRKIVRLATPPGGLVLDPFAGSGTTVEAALLEGMRCIAIEREADYLPLITARIERANES